MQILEDDKQPQVLEIIRPGRLDISQYEFIKVLGTGAFGAVFLVKHPSQDSYCVFKSLSKATVIEKKQVDHLRNELYILNSVSSPFIVKMQGYQQDATYVHIVMEFVIGGEFFNYLSKVRILSNNAASFYAAQIVLVFEYLHQYKIAYRDLKPENILICKNGFIKLTDFGFAKVVEDRTYTICGTPDYLAPEVLLSQGHCTAVDWWGLGVLIYEMLTGRTPFYANEPMAMYQKIIKMEYQTPKQMSFSAKSIIKNLLQKDLTKRFGNLNGGLNDIKIHQFFDGIEWNSIQDQTAKPPYVPKVFSKSDTSNFQEFPTPNMDAQPLDPSEDPFLDW